MQKTEPLINPDQHRYAETKAREWQLQFLKTGMQKGKKNDFF